ncbi:MAG: hypothetical protein RL033_5713 [Pseudomonadota bacterium]|jgi:hypothetical protein
MLVTRGPAEPEVSLRAVALGEGGAKFEANHPFAGHGVTPQRSMLEMRAVSSLELQAVAAVKARKAPHMLALRLLCGEQTSPPGSAEHWAGVALAKRIG